ncbi:vitamin K epoxide reductase family protein [Streptomyces sp. NPDC047043]|uniref:vitamin K epoxide reductase family protein n=1 Tax=Streptomyces sp. NPDC047043 TaxID=3154497 RepID=UPI0033C5E6B9
MTSTPTTVHHLASGSGGDGRKRETPSPGTIGASRAFAWLLIVSGALGILASFVITIDKFQLLQNPRFSPLCNLSPILSCTTVLTSPPS